MRRLNEEIHVKKERLRTVPDTYQVLKKIAVIIIIIVIRLNSTQPLLSTHVGILWKSSPLSIEMLGT